MYFFVYYFMPMSSTTMPPLSIVGASEGMSMLSTGVAKTLSATRIEMNQVNIRMRFCEFVKG